MAKYNYSENEIAVIGIGGIFPEAADVNQFWNNILNKKVSIKRIPDEIVSSEIFFRPELYGKINKEDKSYTHIAGLIDHQTYQKSGFKHKIPPAVAEHMDRNQLASIYCVDQAFEFMGGKPLPKEHTAVILGNGLPGIKYDQVLQRMSFQEIEYYLRKDTLVQGKLSSEEFEEVISKLREEFLKGTIQITEDSSPGVLPNIVAGRITNVFDLRGPSFTVDAACASSLAAISCGAEGLISREYDAVIAGAADVSVLAPGLSLFSGINALSPDGSYPFDSRANGFVIGSGAGVIIMKRLSDAIQNKDKILAVISGYGRASDGKGKYIAAPSEEGQVRAIEMSSRMAGYPVDTIEMLEAHGTGTQVGDPTEVNALKKAFNNLGCSRKEFCGIGSVKSNIGHLRSAAGVPGVLKAIMALDKKILPPTANIREVNPKLKLEGSPFYVLKNAKQWEANSSHPRRAGVSAFGFGGADYHISLEEFREEFIGKLYNIPYPADKNQSINTEASVQGGEKLIQEAVLFSADTRDMLEKEYEKFIAAAETASPRDFRQLVFRNNSIVEYGRNLRLSLMCSGAEELKKKWSTFIKLYESNRINNTEELALAGISFGAGEELAPEKIAVLFPGQASQYANMEKDIYGCYPSFKASYDSFDAIWQAQYGNTVSSMVFGEDENRINEIIKETQNTHPAIFISSYCMYRLFKDMGFEAGYMIGHSLGEVSALAANGMLSFRDAAKLVGKRGYAFASIPQDKRGKMLSIKDSQEEAEKLLEKTELRIYTANINSPSQTVVGGEASEIERLAAILEKDKITHTVLNVSHAFHSPLINSAAESFYNEIRDIKFKQGNAKVIANHLADYYPASDDAADKIPQLLREQITSPVRFADSINKLYNDGVRLFVEIGPGSVLSNLIKDILAGKDIKVITSNLKKKNDIECLNKAIGELFAAGVHIQVSLPVNNTAETVRMPSECHAHKEGIPANSEDINVSEKFSNNTQRAALYSEKLVYSGVSIGLPGTYKRIFSDDNFDLLFEGRNLIERLTDDERQSMAELNITRLVKKEQGSEFRILSAINEVIALAGKFGNLNMEDYLVDADIQKQMTKTVCAAVAAGYEALADAGIPMVKEVRIASNGAVLEGRYVLPEEMRESTGIIFANGFPMVEPFIQEVSRFVAYKFGKKSRQEMIAFYEYIISHTSDYSIKKQLSDWFTLNYSRLSDCSGHDDVYSFNSDFMSQVASQANNRLAQFIGASGPNFQINAACSSTAYAVSLAEDMIRAGRAERMIVIGADNASSKDSLKWLGGGFLSAGAATTSEDLYSAAVPFDNRRNGMIIGAGAVGLVIEKEQAVEDRGMAGICRIVGTHAFNMAGHQTKIDPVKFSEELEKFISRMERENGFSRTQIASDTVYFSHETYTPKKGGCSQTEKISLERVFGSAYRDILICNTKGMTGHTMGGSIEEAVAAKALQYQKVPPIVNYLVEDPELAGLKLSGGGSYSFKYALRGVAGFGGQGNYNLLQNISIGDNRIVNASKYQAWLKAVAPSSEGVLCKDGRLLVIKTQKGKEADTESTLSEGCNAISQSNKDFFAADKNIAGNNAGISSVKAVVKSDIPEKKSIIDSILDIFSEVTKYPKEMLDLDMEMEADLGIDTVKQATIFSMVWERFGIEREEGSNISNYPTIGQIIDLAYSKMSDSPAFSTYKTDEAKAAANTADIENNAQNISGAAGMKAAIEPAEGRKYLKDDVKSEVVKVISEISKYPTDMLDLDMEMEADLGIDTVKQATIISILWERFALNREEGQGIAGYPTIGQVVDLIYSKIPDSPVQTGRQDKQKGSEAVSWDKVQTEVLEVISEISKYPVDMLDINMEMEADLGIDTVKQATVITRLSERYDILKEEWPQVSELLKIESIISTLLNIINKRLSEDAGFQANAFEEAAAAEQPKTGIAEGILQIIAKHTLYPVEMITSDMELQQDLDLDKNKMTSILEDISDCFNVDDFGIEKVSRMNTVGELIDYFKENINRCEEILSETCLGEEEPAGIVWQVPMLVEQELPEKAVDIKANNICIIGDNEAFVNEIALRFADKANDIFTFVFDTELSDDELVKAARECVSKPIDVIIDCSHLGAGIDFSTLSLTEQKEVLQSCGKARFIFYKEAAQQINDLSLRILCAVSIDGGMGYLDKAVQDIDPSFGAVTGFYKGLKREWINCSIRIVDFDKQLVCDKDKFVFHIISEIEASGFDYEIAYNSGKRMVVRIGNFNEQELSHVNLGGNVHFLITGGALGITAEITRALNKKYKGAFTILGRTELPEDIEALAKLSEEQLNEKKSEIQERLAKTYRKVTPVLIQAEFEKLTKAVEIYNMLEDIKASGNSINYTGCDVRDEKSVKKAVNSAVKKNGAVNCLIHAAGIDRSHFIKQKTVKEFDEVYTTKVIGACNLIKFCNTEDLKEVILFSSISGRFGNEAQLDYCAGNSFLNVLAKAIKSKSPSVNAVSIVWSGWKDIGIASRNEYIKQNASKIGIKLINTKSGVDGFIKLLESKLDISEVILSEGLENLTDPRLFINELDNAVLIDRVDKRGSLITKAYKTFSVNKDALIDQHRLRNVPLLPAACIMELCAEYFALQAGRQEGYCLRKLEFLNPFKLFRDADRELFIEGKPDNDSWDISVYSYFKPQKMGGETLIRHGGMLVSGKAENYDDMHPLNWEWVTSNNFSVTSKLDLKDILLDSNGNQILSLGALYWRMAETDELRELDNFLHNERGVIFPELFPTEQIYNSNYPLDRLLINPCFIDAMYQGAAQDCVTKKKNIYLPWRVEEFGIIKVPRKDGFFRVFAEAVSEDEEYRTYRIAILDEKDELCSYARNATFRLISN
ncbi:malonyl CoA-acyl carrier protein transacylase [Ruminiclostridium sufflavum DSM 19573]|uniref:Malonyl CoA-acyl carrier protein transacylase n=1 Tax=Ruminiclostridium sufflavum DSM 19573 TaxID=1121337 RepID=A0A318XL04_9FIRM|nr:type I polyketide synthase [Ruminiclostridium sufflavum]PYG85774.1 malonyl CoA-acyl carrier protein transacylase [Ruminiclostridium sufflavum DSM 19573]